MNAPDVPPLAVLGGHEGLTERAASWTRSPARRLELTAGLALLYFGAGKAGLALATVNPSASAVWPPTGLAIAALLLFGPALWPGVLVGAFAVNATSAGTLATSLGIACGNTLEAVVAAFLVTRLARGRHAFERSADVFRYALFSGASALISATLGVTTLAASEFVPWAGYGHVWTTWWLGDVVSAWVVTPFVLEWCNRSDDGIERGRLAELAGLFTCLLAVVGLAFFAEPFAAGTRRNPFTFLCLPPLVWASYRFPRRIVATATLLLAATAVLVTFQGYGPFTSEDKHMTLLFLQSFMGVVAITVLAVCATVSQSQRAAEDLQRRSAQLHRSNEELEQFATVASHDLQEPLRVTASYLQLLERRCGAKLAPDETQYLNQALDSTGRMRELIDGLLSFSRLEPGGAFVPVDLERVLDRALESLHLALDEARPELERGPLPVVSGDETQLVQVFQNLIGNGLKFRRPASPARIRIEARAHGDQWHVSVQDDGIGIQPAAFERIFLLFQRLHHRDEYPGTGLGLAICKKIVERHGGRLWVESRPGEGSTFSFSIPRSEE